jgi:hypothetical protein
MCGAMPNHLFDLFDLKAFRVGVGCVLGMAMSGCAVIDQMHSDGTITRSFAFGAPVIVPTDPSGQSSVSKVNGLGLIVSNTETTLGWVDETLASLGPDCRVVLIGNTEQQLERFAALLPKKEALCSDSKLNGGQK